MSRGVPDALLYVAAVVGALGVLWRALKARELLRGVRLFLVDWFGSPGRPGVAAVPSFPERMSEVETATVAIVDSIERLHDAQGRSAEAFALLDQRVSDHRRRNEEQAELLRAAMQERLDRLQTQNDAYRASLHELGLDLDPPTTGAPL